MKTKQVTLPTWARWEQRPVDAGQMVDSHYATDGEWLYERQYDHTDRVTSYSRKRLSKRVDLDRDMDVPNGKLPRTVGRSQEVEVIDERHSE